MATKDDTTPKAAAAKAPAKAADPTPAKDTPAKDTTPAAVTEGERVSTCVVNRGRGMHVGNAVNGKVCSYHAMHYDAAGNRR